MDLIVKVLFASTKYTQRTVLGNVQVRGEADPASVVTVNENPTWRNGEYFYGGDYADNSAVPVFKELEIAAVVPASSPDDWDEMSAVTGRVFVAQNPEQFTYDADGNMLTDGRFRYTWNGENRLVRAQELVAPTNRHPYTVSYAYDHRGRMVSKRITENDGQDTLVKSIAYLWDGWNIIREIQWPVASGQWPVVTDNVWGLDLDGTLQGAGGVGGLLAVQRSDCATTNSAFCILHSALYLPTYDANGNVSEYIDESGELVAHYDYSPFGETLIESGDLASTFTHRFSTKPWCPVTGLYEYQMRKYRPEIGRWLSRDPVDESFSILLLNFLSILHSTQFVRQHPFFSAKYAFVLNNCNLVDVLGEQPRDKYYGLPERFWHWYHKNVKQNGDPDLTKEEAHDEYDNWVKQGKPGADSKDNRGKDSSNKNPGKECEPIETEDDERNEEDDIPHEQNFKPDSQTVDGKQIANLIVISIISAFISYLLYSAGFAPL